MEKLNTRMALMEISKALRRNLAQYAGEVPDLKNVGFSIDNYLSSLKTRRIVNDFQSATVNQLWQVWTLKQKSKWLFHRHTPFIREAGFKIVKGIQDRNHEKYMQADTDGTDYDLLDLESIPEHLTPDPKMIVVADLCIKPSLSVDFIKLNIDISGEKNERA